MRPRALAGILVAALAALSILPVALAHHLPFAPGNVISTSGTSALRRFSPTGTLLETFNASASSGPAGGLCFDGSGNLYATYPSTRAVTKFNHRGAVLNASFGNGFFEAPPVSCVADAAGNVYVGHNVGPVDGNREVLKFNAAGALVDAFNVITDHQGVRAMDLAADQCSLYYAAQGTAVRRFDVCTRTQLPDFVDTSSTITGVRIRPNGEVLVAVDSAVYRLSPSAAFIEVYLDPISGGPGRSLHQEVALDPNGTSFWTKGRGDLYRFNVMTREVERQFFPEGSTHAGFAIFGEPRVALSAPPLPTPTPLGPTFLPGHVLTAWADSQIRRFSAQGIPLQTFNLPAGSALGGDMCFDAAGNLYVPSRGANTVTKLNNQGALLSHPFGSGLTNRPSSCVVDASGNVYVGQGGTSSVFPTVAKLSSTGTLLATYQMETQNFGSFFIDLAADQCTLFYTDGTWWVKRYDVCTNTQLADFVPANPDLQGMSGLRIRANGEVVVAGDFGLYRYGAAGALLKHFPAPDLIPESLSSLELDPDGATVWAFGPRNSQMVYRIDLATGVVHTAFTRTSAPYFAGLGVYGAPVAARPGNQSVPTPTASATNTPSPSPSPTPTRTVAATNIPTGMPIPTAIPDLAVEASVEGTGPYQLNQVVSYVDVVRNLGGSIAPAERVLLMHRLSAGTTFLSAVGDGVECTLKSPDVTCEHAGLAAGESFSVRIQVRLPSRAPGSRTLTSQAEVNPQRTIYEQNRQNNRSQASLLVQ
jgi:streptogramin lyase